MTSRHCRVVAASVALSLTLSTACGQPAAAAEPSNLRCTAALRLLSERQVQTWAAQPSLAGLALYETTLRRGGAFIAQAYLAGSRDEAVAKQALAQEQALLQAMPGLRLEELQSVCSAKGDALLAEASSVQKWLLERLVKRQSAKERGKLLESAPKAP